MRVEVYYNLHRKCLSVRALEGENKGKVFSHPAAVSLHDVKFVVQPAGRDRVRLEGRKNVHAFVRGTLNLVYGTLHANVRPHGVTREITYNPYKFDSFVERTTETPVHDSKYVFINGRNITSV
jgi:hypothetical protein